MTSPRYEQQAATLHGCTRRVSHPDSEEAVRIERQRVAQELEPFQRRTASRITSQASNKRGDVSVQPRDPSHRSSNASNAPLQNRESLESYATTQPDLSPSQGSSIRENHWYSPIMKFWTTHVRFDTTTILHDAPLTHNSLTIDEGAHRDHLGTRTLPQLKHLIRLTARSARAHLPRLSPYLPHPRHDGRHHRPALPHPARSQFKPQDRLLRCW